MKRRIYIASLGSAALVGIIVLGLLAIRPRMPGSWSKLHAGMTQKEVESALDCVDSSLGNQNWQKMMHEAPMLGAHSRWLLWVEYDGPVGPGFANTRLKHATAKFVHPFPLLSSKPRKLL